MRVFRGREHELVDSMDGFSGGCHAGRGIWLQLKRAMCLSAGSRRPARQCAAVRSGAGRPHVAGVQEVLAAEPAATAAGEISLGQDWRCSASACRLASRPSALHCAGSDRSARSRHCGKAGNVRAYADLHGLGRRIAIYGRSCRSCCSARSDPMHADTDLRTAVPDWW